MAQTVSPNNNGPNASKKATIAPPAVIANDTRSLQDRLVDQQWRDVVRLGIHKNHATTINTNSTYNKGVA